MLKSFISLLCIFLATTGSLRAASDTFVDYQNYNHGYCPNCHCYPCQCADAAADVEEEEEDGVVEEEGVVEAVAVPEEAEEEVAETAACTPAVVCATNCGLSLWWLGLIIAGVATTAAVVIGSNNGHAK